MEGTITLEVFENRPTRVRCEPSGIVFEVHPREGYLVHALLVALIKRHVER
jgi:hypothetical protein